MSNLVKAITATDTGDRKYIKQNTSQLFQDMFSGREEVQTIFSPEIAKVYKIGVTLGSTCMVPEYMELANANTLSEAIGRTKRQVIEAVFGEFRQDFRAIERHLYNYEFEEAATALRAMEHRMFTTED